MESFTKKGLVTTAVAAVIAMACVFGLMNRAALVVTNVGPLEASPDMPVFKSVGAGRSDPLTTSSFTR